MLRESAASIISQSWKHLDIIIVDDGFAKETRDVVEELLQQDARIRYFRTGGGAGPGGGRQLGMQQALSDYVAFLDDDDLAVPDRIQLQAEYLESHPEIGLLYGQAQFLDQAMQPFLVHPQDKDMQAFNRSNSLEYIYTHINYTPAPSSLMLRRSMIKSIGGFVHGVMMGEDYLFVLKAAAAGIGIAVLPYVVVKMRRGKDHVSIVTDRVKARISVLSIFDTFKEWVIESKFKIPESLHRRARANQLLAIANEESILRALGRALQAAIIVPFDISVYTYMVCRICRPFTRVIQGINKH